MFRPSEPNPVPTNQVDPRPTKVKKRITPIFVGPSIDTPAPNAPPPAITTSAPAPKATIPTVNTPTQSAPKKHKMAAMSAANSLAKRKSFKITSKAKPSRKSNGGNSWVAHIRKFAEANKMSYACALSDPQCKKTYDKNNPKDVNSLKHKKTECDECKEASSESPTKKAVKPRKSIVNMDNDGDETLEEKRAHFTNKYGVNPDDVEGIQKAKDTHRVSAFNQWANKWGVADEDDEYERITRAIFGGSAPRSL